MRFRYDGKTYTRYGLEDMSLQDILDLKAEAPETITDWKFSMVDRIMKEAQADQDVSLEDSLLLAAVFLWVSLRHAGEPISFAVAVATPMSAVEFIETPQDHQAPAGPTRARKGKSSTKKSSSGSPRPGSALVRDLSDSSETSPVDGSKGEPISTTPAAQSLTA